MQAYRIVDWWKFELLKNGKLATEKTKMGALRIKPLIYVRFPVHGHNLTADYRRMVKRAGPEMAAACDGIYKMLVGLAGNQVREYRGWILDDRQQPLDPGQVAELLCLSEERTRLIFEILSDRAVKWVSLEEFPEALHKSFNEGDLSSEPQIKKSGNNWEKKGAPLNETETEDKGKGFDSKRIESEEGDFGKKEDREGDDLDENAVQPQARPPASVSVSATDTASDSKKLSDSVSAPTTASVSAPGAGPGAEVPGSFTDGRTGPIKSDSGLPGGRELETEASSGRERFEIIRECQKATLELTQIIHPRNSSDMTTINDIFAQLKNRLISGSPYPLFELALNTARQCWRADKPIAMFVAAMKKPPFHYVPKKLHVIPGNAHSGIYRKD